MIATDKNSMQQQLTGAIRQQLYTLLSEKTLTVGGFNIISSVLDALSLYPTIQDHQAWIDRIWNTAAEHVAQGGAFWVMVQRRILDRQLHPTIDPNDHLWMKWFTMDDKTFHQLLSKKDSRNPESQKLLDALWSLPAHISIPWIFTERDFKKIEKLVQTDQSLYKKWDVLANLTSVSENNDIATRWKLIDMIQSMISKEAISPLALEDNHDHT